jgi:CRISPR/Cas system-associated exonuclease Cas4 (RecB family)
LILVPHVSLMDSATMIPEIVGVKCPRREWFIAHLVASHWKNSSKNRGKGSALHDSPGSPALSRPWSYFVKAEWLRCYSIKVQVAVDTQRCFLIGVHRQRNFEHTRDHVQCARVLPISRQDWYLASGTQDRKALPIVWNSRGINRCG